jgi:dienelactone hydrolase
VARWDAQALAELGFVVVEIDGMGTPWRSKKFHEAYYGDMGDNTLPDQIAGMKELARRYPWIDITRVGIYGHSGGGYAAVAAMFHYPDFFKVGIAESGNHDNRYEDDWAEVRPAPGAPRRRLHELRQPGQSELRKDLKGKLPSRTDDGQQRPA